MSGRGSFTRLWWECAFTLQQDPHFWSMLLWFLTVLVPNKFIFFLLCPTHPIPVLLLSPTPLSLSLSLLPQAFCRPLLYWFCEVQWLEHSAGNGKGMGSMPTKFQAFPDLSHPDKLSAGFTPLHCTGVFCFVIGAYQCQVSLLAPCVGRTLQNAAQLHWFACEKCIAHLLVPDESANIRGTVHVL